MRGVGTLNKATPLWIIDGVPGMPLDNFNEVESIQLLKDAASAAIYGIEAANGVVLVTTKKDLKENSCKLQRICKSKPCTQAT